MHVIYPRGRLEEIGAERSKEKIGGSERLRLCLDDLDNSFYRIAAVRDKTIRCAWWGYFNYYPFTVDLNGKKEKIWLSEKSLQLRLRVQPRFIKKASENNRLDWLLQLALFQTKEAQYRDRDAFINSIAHPIHFSTKDFEIDRPMYVNNQLIAYGVPEENKLIGKGSSARVKSAMSIDGEKIVRRICDVTEKNEVLIESTIRTMEKLNDKPGVLKLLAVFKYTTSNGKKKLVTFHPRYDHDLFDLIDNLDIVISLKTRIGYMRQLLDTLCAIEGAHRDLKPENIVVKGDQLAILDFEYYLEHNKNDLSSPGTPPWAAPEVLDDAENKDTRKLDVWPLGIIFYMLFTHPNHHIFSWLTMKRANDIIKSINQKEINQSVDKANISPAAKKLLLKMIAIDPNSRYTIYQAATEFQKILTTPPAAG